MGGLIVAGFESEWCEFAQQRLVEMGVAQVRDDTALGLLPSEFLEKVEVRWTTQSQSNGNLTVNSMGRAWDLAAAAIFIGNADVPHWSWADPRHIYLLDFWANFDPDTVFVLIYGSFAPELKQTSIGDREHQSALESGAQGWHDYHSALLHFFHSFPERCLLVHVDQFNGSSKRVVERLAQRFDIPTRRLNRSRNRETSMIAGLLAEARFADQSEVSEVFSELEQSADFPRPASDEDKLTRLMRAQTELDEYRIAVDKVASLEEINVDLEQRLSSSGERVADQTAQIENLISVRANGEQRVAALEIESRNLRQTIQQLNRKLAVAIRNSKEDAKGRQNESGKSDESKLLSLQLAQAREELELYFRKYQDTKQQLTDALSAGAGNLNSQASTSEPVETESSENSLSIDFRNYFEGSGWHNAEHQGRWIGAEDVSTVIIPNLKQRDYQLTLKIVDAMSNQHMEQLRVSINGRTLVSSLKVLSNMGGRLAPARRLRARVTGKTKLVPAELTVSIPREVVLQSGQANVISIASIAPISPSAIGQTDGRKLSVCFETMKIQG